MTWTCRYTLDHIVNTLMFYSGHVATLATTRQPSPRNGDPDLDNRGTLHVLRNCAAIFARLCAQMPPEGRAFHGSGMADASGYISLGCEEILLHTWDITEALGSAAALAPATTSAVASPGAPSRGGCATTWMPGTRCCGARAASRCRIARNSTPTWWYWTAPLEESDGVRRFRTSPPNWT